MGQQKSKGNRLKVRKTFVLGVGAPKSGTTWLYNYISQQQCSNMGVRKEYRILKHWLRDAPIQQKFNFYRLVSWRGFIPWLDWGQLIRLRMIAQEGYYESYFDGLLKADGFWLTGDISPGYMTLSVDQLRVARDRLRARGFDVKVVFLMRDPVERIWSGARMRKRNRDAGYDGLSDIEAVRAIINDPGVTARTRYDKTLNTLDAVFKPDEMFLALYEEMFTPREIGRLSDFLGVPTDDSLRDLKFNITEREGTLDPDLIAGIRKAYAPVYALCHARFPKTKYLWI